MPDSWVHSGRNSHVAPGVKCFEWSIKLEKPICPWTFQRLPHIQLTCTVKWSYSHDQDIWVDDCPCPCKQGQKGTCPTLIWKDRWQYAASQLLGIGPSPGWSVTWWKHGQLYSCVASSSTVTLYIWFPHPNLGWELWSSVRNSTPSCIIWVLVGLWSSLVHYNFSQTNKLTSVWKSSFRSWTNQTLCKCIDFHVRGPDVPQHVTGLS